MSLLTPQAIKRNEAGGCFMIFLDKEGREYVAPVNDIVTQLYGQVRAEVSPEAVGRKVKGAAFDKLASVLRNRFVG